MAADNTKLYNDFFKTYCAAHPEKKRQTCQIEANDRWKQLKDGDASSFPSRVSDCLQELTSLSRKKKGSVLQFFSSIPSKPNNIP